MTYSRLRFFSHLGCSRQLAPPGRRPHRAPAPHTLGRKERQCLSHEGRGITRQRQFRVPAARPAAAACDDNALRQRHGRQRRPRTQHRGNAAKKAQEGPRCCAVTVRRDEERQRNSKMEEVAVTSRAAGRASARKRGMPRCTPASGSSSRSQTRKCHRTRPLLANHRISL